MRERRFSPAKLKKAREDTGKTFEQFAVAIGVTGMTVRNWENGVHIPDVAGLQAISRETGKPLDFFFESD